MQLGRVRPAEPEEPEPRARRPPALKAPSLPAVSEPSRLVCRARYAAVDRAGHGLINLGMDSYGARILLVHRRGGISLSTGDSLDFKGAPGVRIQWTTRHRYYSPGHKVTTLVVGVSDAEWAVSLASGAARGVRRRAPALDI